jgi:hypothetical protein
MLLQASIYAVADKMLHKIANVNLLLNQLLSGDKKE